MVFGLAVLNRVWYYELRDCEQSLSFLRLRHRAAPYERLKVVFIINQNKTYSINMFGFFVNIKSRAQKFRTN